MKVKKNTFVAQVWHGGGLYIRRIFKAIGWLKDDEEYMLLQFKYVPKYDCLIVKKLEELKINEEEVIKDGIKENS